MIFLLKNSVIGLILLGIFTLILLILFIYAIVSIIQRAISYKQFKKNNTIDCQIMIDNYNNKNNNKDTQVNNEIGDLYQTEPDTETTLEIPTTPSNRKPMVQAYMSQGFFPPQPCPIKSQSYRPPSAAIRPPPPSHGFRPLSAGSRRPPPIQGYYPQTPGKRYPRPPSKVLPTQSEVSKYPEDCTEQPYWEIDHSYSPPDNYGLDIPISGNSNESNPYLNGEYIQSCKDEEAVNNNNNEDKNKNSNKQTEKNNQNIEEK